MAIPTFSVDLSTGLVLEVGGARDMVFNRPPSAVEGSKIGVIIGVESASAASQITWTPPSGWTLAYSIDLSGGSSSFPLIGVWERVVGPIGSEPSTYQFSYAQAAGTINNGIGCIGILGGTDATLLDTTPTLNGQSSTSNPVTVGLDTLTADVLKMAITVSSDGRFLTAQDSGYPSGWTGVFARAASVSSVSPVMAIAIQGQASAGPTGTATFTGLQTSGSQHRTLLLPIRALQVTITPIIESAPATIYNGQVGAAALTGSGFEAAKGTGALILSPGAHNHPSAITQPTLAWGDTSVTPGTINTGSLPFDTDLYWYIRNNSGNVNAAGVVVQRQARIYIRDDFENLDGVDVASASNINWKVFLDATLATVIDSGTGLTTNVSGVFEIGPIAQGSLNPNASDPVWLASSQDGAVGTATGTLIKVNPVYE